MKWSGETYDQWRERVADWHPVFLWFPQQMRNGRWVCLETVWRIAHSNCRGGYWFEYSDAVTRPERIERPSSSPPSKPKR